MALQLGALAALPKDSNLVLNIHIRRSITASPQLPVTSSLRDYASKGVCAHTHTHTNTNINK